MTRSKHIKGSHVLITGGGSGIGRLMALDAAQRGARRIVIWDLSEEAGQSACREIEALGIIGTTATAEAIDVSDRRAVAAEAETTGSIDILINSAGIVTGKPFLEASPEAIEKTMNVNVLALYWVTRAFLPGMLERNRGTVVNVASAAGLVGVAKQTDYSASKFAAVGFTESLRMELAKQRCKVSTLIVCPYYIDTGMFDGVTTRFPRLLPILRPEYVSKRILDAIEAGKSQLVMPRLVRILPILRVLPTAQFDWVMNLFGINNGMDGFAGRAFAGRASTGPTSAGPTSTTHPKP